MILKIQSDDVKLKVGNDGTVRDGLEKEVGACLLSDLDIFAELAPGTPFKMIWKLHNCGTFQWFPKVKLSHVNGCNFCGTEEVDVILPPGGVKSGDNIEISVDMVAPEAPGIYEGQWRLKRKSSFAVKFMEFGNHFQCRIQVFGKRFFPNEFLA